MIYKRVMMYENKKINLKTIVQRTAEQDNKKLVYIYIKETCTQLERESRRGDDVPAELFAGPGAIFFFYHRAFVLNSKKGGE